MAMLAGFVPTEAITYSPVGAALYRAGHRRLTRRRHAPLDFAPPAGPLGTARR